MGFSSDLQNDQAYVNGIGRFNITVSDNNDKVTWFQNGKAIADNVSMLKFERVVDGNKRALIVKNCTKSDFATYAAECAGQKKEAKLSQQSSFVQKISDVEGYKGDIAVFECRVTPGSIVAWSFKGKKINRADFSILKFEERTVGDCAMLCVKNITKNEFAKFSAEARGETCEAKLNEKLPFVGKMDSVSGLAGDIEVFMVQVQPATHVSWFKGSTKITKQNFSILKFEERWDGNFRELVVKNINAKDCGEYRVEARGSSQSAKLSITKDKNQTTTALRAKAGPRKEMSGASKAVKKVAANTDAFAKVPKSLNGKDGGIEVFECEVKDASASCQWYKGNTKIDSSSFSILKYECVTEGSKRKLIVKNIRRQDVGEYQCKAGASAVTIKLTVGARKADGSAMTVGDLGLKRKPMINHNDTAALLASALEKAKSSNKKWVRHPNYYNLWIMNPDFVEA